MSEEADFLQSLLEGAQVPDVSRDWRYDMGRALIGRGKPLGIMIGSSMLSKSPTAQYQRQMRPVLERLSALRTLGMLQRAEEKAAQDKELNALNIEKAQNELDAQARARTAADVGGVEKAAAEARRLTGMGMSADQANAAVEPLVPKHFRYGADEIGTRGFDFAGPAGAIANIGAMAYTPGRPRANFAALPQPDPLADVDEQVRKTQTKFERYRRLNPKLSEEQAWALAQGRAMPANELAKVDKATTPRGVLDANITTLMRGAGLEGQEPQDALASDAGAAMPGRKKIFLNEALRLTALRTRPNLTMEDVQKESGLSFGRILGMNGEALAGSGVGPAAPPPTPAPAPAIPTTPTQPAAAPAGPRPPSQESTALGELNESEQVLAAELHQKGFNKRQIAEQIKLARGQVR